MKMSRKEEKNNFNNIPVLSFFTGAGFLDLGFAKAGFDIIWHNENCESFVKGYEHAMANMEVSPEAKKIQNTSSIIDLGPNTIAREAFKKTKKPDEFGIIGGPPCPDFSVGGKNEGAKGSKGKLSKVFVNRIIELQPTFFLFENVPGLVRTKKHRAYFDELCKELSKHYLITSRVLDALEFGVPQERKRLFLVGFNLKWIKKRMGNKSISVRNDQWFPWDEYKYFKNAKNQYRWPTTSPFGDYPRRPSGVPKELMVGPLICDQAALGKLPNGQECFNPKSDKFGKIEEGDDSRKSFKRLHRWRYSPTAAYGNNEVHLHPVEPRRLTVRETLRIQSVPDEYVLPEDMSLSFKFKTIGNGVPVKLAYAVARSIGMVLKGGIDENF